MSFNTLGAVEVPLELFGGLVTETAPPNLPGGVSPDNQDVIFAPGQVAGRPGLQKVFGTPFPGTPTVSYGKSYVDPLGVVRNLYLDSGGTLHVENVTSGPGTYSTLTTTTPETYAQSVTAFGREYIAISDGLHGQEVPLQYDGTNLDRVTQDGPGTSPTVANQAGTSVTLTSLTRSSNVVTVVTSGSHGLQVGYQAQIQGVTAATVGSISSITINNEEAPGLATVTTGAAHGLTPGNYVTITGVQANTLAPITVSTLYRYSQITTVVTSAAHGLSYGTSITIPSCPDNSFLGSFVITSVPSPTAFTFVQVGADASVASPGTTVVQINWPLPQTTTPTYFEVQSAPTTTTFQIPMTYSDGTWTTGTVSFAWDGIFYVSSVVSATSYTYQQYGPDSTSGAVGTSTAHGQISPGEHSVQCFFITRQGYTTRPSPPVKFVANGGQYLSVTNIPIGPSNVVARVLAFTGALGSQFFYIPVQGQVNGQVISTATQINDNTTTSAVLDFSDNTLFSSVGICIPGNNLAAQVVLDSALGFGYYGSRLLAYGVRNRVQNLLNMGFDGGYLSGTPTLPTGWKSTGGGGALAAGHYGQGWQISVAPGGPCGQLSQGAYEDGYGAPILTPNTNYRLRCWIKASAIAADVSLTATLSSVSASFTSTATISGSLMSTTGSWLEAPFGTKIGSVPSDMLLTIYGASSASSVTLLVDELSVVYSDTPYLDTVLFGSYVDNPEGFDGTTGKFGPANDTRKVMGIGTIRDNLCIVTQDPGGRLHQTYANGVTEPAGWTVNEIAGNCGALSAFGVMRSQADDATGAGGEEWLAWASLAGARIFGGDAPHKISQEIQPDWDTINAGSATTIWALNDPVSRTMYFGLPIIQNPALPPTAPNLIYAMSYRSLDTAYMIANSPPVHTSFAGKLIATDNARKWTRWNMKMNGAALMYRSATQTIEPVLFGGNGSSLGTSSGYGNVYILNPCNMADDDYGAILPYYVTYFFVNHQEEMALQLGAHRKMLAYYTMFIQGSAGYVTVTPLADALYNPWPLTVKRALQANPTFDFEWTGGQVTAQRIAFKIAWSLT